MDAETIHEVVRQLTGDIQPHGETHIDNRNLKNLQVLGGVMGLLLQDIILVEDENENSHEFSVKRAANCAKLIIRQIVTDCNLHEDLIDALKMFIKAVNYSGPDAHDYVAQAEHTATEALQKYSADELQQKQLDAINNPIGMELTSKPKKPTGMYGETPRVQIGKYTVCRQDETSIWIEHENGEGSQFSDTLFEPFLEEFYLKYF